VKHESFTYPAISHEKMAIVGITSSVKPIKKSELRLISDIMYSSLYDKRRELSLVQMDEVVKATGKKLQSQSLKEYQLTGSLSAPVMDELKQSLEGIRYVIFARIDTDDISRHESITYRAKDGKEIPSYKEGAVEVHKRETTRWETVSLHVFDLVRGIPAWGGSVTKSDSRHITFDVTPDNHSLKLANVAVQALVGVANVMITGQVDDASQSGNDYPGVEQQEIMKKIFHGFAENLPTQKN
jgi:hypothetical protein